MPAHMHMYNLICLAINTIGIKLEVMNGITLLIPEIVVVYASYKHTFVEAHMHMQVHVHKHAQSTQQISTYLVKVLCSLKMNYSCLLTH